MLFLLGGSLRNLLEFLLLIVENYKVLDEGAGIFLYFLCESHWLLETPQVAQSNALNKANRRIKKVSRKIDPNK